MRPSPGKRSGETPEGAARCPVGEAAAQGESRISGKKSKYFLSRIMSYAELVSTSFFSRCLDRYIDNSFILHIRQTAHVYMIVY